LPGRYGLTPAFIAGPRGRLLLMRWAPSAPLPAAEILIVPPFGEEMNRARRQLALTAQAFAARGAAATLLDLTGTGDSDGEFADATPSLWQEDIHRAARALRATSGAPLMILGLRLGGLLVLAAAGAMAPEPARLILWQPVTSGEAFLTQVLRIRLAATLAHSPGTAETTKSLRQRLAAGETLEIAGYPIAPDLARGLDALSMADPPAGCRTLWLEVGAAPRDTIGPAGARLVDHWRQSGHAVAAATVAAPPFWTLMETETAPTLTDATLAFANEMAPA